VRQLCVDVGGTFTDLLVLDEDGELTQFKAPTTPSDPTEGFFNAIDKAAGAGGEDQPEFLAQVDLIVHGTTLATNVLLTLTGASVGMLTTEGFRDVIEMRRGIREVEGSVFDTFNDPVEPLIPRWRRLGVPERTVYTGEVIEPLDESALKAGVKQLLDEGVEAIAVCFLHSYANSENEARAAELVEATAPGIYVTSSSEVLPTWREFERFSTTAVSAYVGPAVAGYIESLTDRLTEKRFGGRLLMMLSSGLVQEARKAARRGVDFLASGPAAAPSAAQFVAGEASGQHLLEVDMGGTSFDVSLLRDGEIGTTTEAWVGEHRVATKMVDVSSVGAGGGSIAWVDSLGLLRVGPQSAGADPGPAAYGTGSEPTVTDADVILGLVPADYFLGGELELDVGRATDAVGRLGAELGLDAEETAEAVYVTVNSVMANQITEVCTRRGFDVRDCTMVAGGGAAGVHAAEIGRRLGIRQLVVPHASALMSAFGMFTMDLGQEYVSFRATRAGEHDAAEIQSLVDGLVRDAHADFLGMGIPADELVLQRSIEMRYAGQYNELEIEVDSEAIDDAKLAELAEAFHVRHEAVYGYAMLWREVEFLTVHVRATSPRKPTFSLKETPGSGRELADCERPPRRARLDGTYLDTRVFDADLLEPGHEFAGPSLVDGPSTTVLVPDGFSCRVDGMRNYWMDWVGEPGESELSGVVRVGARQATEVAP
jgi:N-methylhydantoinase A